jgi:DNA-binding LytR/AlgR family response regulator
MLVRRSLAEWDRLMPKTGFHRIGRSLILRRASIQKIQSVSRDIHHVFLIESSAPLVLSRQAGRILIRILEETDPPSSTDI